jgi:hypothetical protein
MITDELPLREEESHELEGQYRDRDNRLLAVVSIHSLPVIDSVFAIEKKLTKKTPICTKAS